jgi:hypothetical protein
MKEDVKEKILSPPLPGLVTYIQPCLLTSSACRCTTSVCPPCSSYGLTRLRVSAGPFSYADGKRKGLIIGKKATFIIATGGIYDGQTQMASFNFVEPYLRSVFSVSTKDNYSKLRILS